MKINDLISACLSVFGLMLLSFSVFGQKNVDQIFRKYKNDEGVMNLNFTGDVKKYLKSANVDLKSEIKNIEVFIFENGKGISSRDKAEISSALNKGGYDLLVDVKDKSNNVKIYALEEGRYLSHIYANVTNSDANIFFMLSGKILLEELSKLNLNFEGSDALKMLGGGK
ncbi:MAG: DUF4252 domain-containing protein [Saprospiraceae bacterium]|nr:DUF4252 domain-containing protein [Saprospiraceae bacterium]